jgi:hypothetical protein
MLSKKLTNPCPTMEAARSITYLIPAEGAYNEFCANEESISYVGSMGWIVRIPPSAFPFIE